LANERFKPLDEKTSNLEFLVDVIEAAAKTCARQWIFRASSRKLPTPLDTGIMVGIEFRLEWV